MEKKETLISVEMAKAMLKGHVNARPLSPEMVDEMVADIKAGTFDKENVNLVIKNGRLIVGQHVLNAIIKADMPLEVNTIVLGSNDKFNPGVNRNMKYHYVFPKDGHWMNRRINRRINKGKDEQGNS